MKKLIQYTIISLIICSQAYSQQTEIQYLSGTGSDHTVNWEFFCTEGMNSGKWTSIPVPSNWELQGFGGYNYGYNKREGRAQEKGLYKYSFTVSKEWQNKKVNIVFEGSMTDTEVRINGQLAGPVHQGAFYPFTYDISGLLTYNKENLLEVSVSKVSSNETINKAEREADYWIFGGIFRPVYLEAFPLQHIQKLMIDADANGHFLSDIYLSDNMQADILMAQMIAPDGKPINKPMQAKIAGKNKITVESWVADAQLWSPEFPNLYKIEVKLFSKGTIIHSISEKFGFRTIELRERDGIYLNGVKIKFKGINRHCFWPSTGRCLNRQISLDDAMLIKDMNMNVVRNSHYPADHHFYEICDSIGLMVFDELGGWHDAYDTKVGTILVKEMIDKSHNHPCVVMWINGNEGGHNHELLPVYETMDIQKRPIIHAWQIFRNMDTQHYRDYDYGIGSHFHGHDVFFPTEFLHGLYDGGHGAGMEDFWKLMWDNPLSAGGLTWNFADEAVIRTDKQGILDTDGNHGADGIVGPYHEKEASYYTLKEVWAPLFFEHREITKHFDGTFRIENRFHFTNTSQCKFTWKLAQIPDPYHPSNDRSVNGGAVSPDIIPGAKDTLKINLPDDWMKYDILYITAFDPCDHEVFTWSWPIILPDDYAERMVRRSGSIKAVVEEKDTILSATLNDMKISWSKNTGLLLRVFNQKGEISFNKGPTLCEGISLFKNINSHYEGNDLIVESLFEENSVMRNVRWTLYPSGWLKLDVEYCPLVERHILLGINFSYPEEKVESIQWMGDGPYRVWKNRLKGNSLNIWEKKYNNTITGQSEYIYPEFKGYHSRMYWLKVNTKEQPFIVVCPDEDVFFRMYTPETPKDPYNTAPPFPSGDISFMQGIAPIGTKSLQTYRMGPMSEKNLYYSRGGTKCLFLTLYFDFSGK